jgi:hypothetical protein
MTTADRLDAILTELRTTNLLLSAMAAAHDRDHLQAAQVRWQLGHDGGIAEIQHFASQRGPGGRCERPTSNLRNASGASRLPWLGRSVTLIRVDTTGVVDQGKTDSEKRALLATATSKDLVLIAWPGQWSQEVYVVDDLKAARAAVQD